MQYHGVELNVNLFHAGFAERYERALEQMGEEIKSLPAGSLAESIRGQTGCVERFVSTVFGPEVYPALGLDADDLNEHLDLVEAIVEETARQKGAAQQRFARYSPERSRRHHAGER